MALVMAASVKHTGLGLLRLVRHPENCILFVHDLDEDGDAFLMSIKRM